MSAHRPHGEAVNVDLVLEKVVAYESPAATLFALFVSEEWASHWMGAKVEIDAVAGGDVFVATDGWPVVTGHVVQIDEPKSLTLRWGAVEWSQPLETTIVIRSDGDGASLALRETGYGEDDDLLRRRSWLWSHWLVRLAAAGRRFDSSP